MLTSEFLRIRISTLVVWKKLPSRFQISDKIRDHFEQQLTRLRLTCLCVLSARRVPG